MSRSRRLWTFVALATVLAWSVVMTALGQAAALITLIPPLAFLLQQVLHAVAGSTGTPARAEDTLPPTVTLQVAAPDTASAERPSPITATALRARPVETSAPALPPGSTGTGPTGGPRSAEAAR